MNPLILVLVLSTAPIKAGEPAFMVTELNEQIPEVDEIGSPTNPSESICIDDLDFEDISFDFLDIGNDSR